MADEPPGSIVRKRFLQLLTWVFYLTILAFVSRRAMLLWIATPQESLPINGFWLLLAGCSYIVGWLPSVWFWRAILQSLRQKLGFWQAIRAYYVGHLGKYVPGKALALVIRASLVKDAGIAPLTAGVAAAYETLVFMATGTALAVAFSPMAFGESFWSRLPARLSWLHENQWIVPPIVMIGTFATTPLSAWLFTRLCRKVVKTDSTDSNVLPRISAGLVSQGVAATSLGWICHALSLGFVLQSISSRPFDLAQFPVWMASCALSTVGGFVVLIAPGGFGVREGLLIEALKGQDLISPKMALVAAGLLRAVWFTAELTSAALLMIVPRKTNRT